MSDNPYQQSVILHGGHADGQRRTLSAEIVRRGVYREYPTLTLKAYMASTIPLPSFYERRHLQEGEPGTCECRDWYEWHYVGENK